MAKKQKININEICEAIIKHGSIRKAAEALNTTQPDLLQLISEDDNKAALLNARADAISEAANIGTIEEALQVVKDIMNDTGADENIRLRAADIFINHVKALQGEADLLRSAAEREADIFTI